MSPLPRSRGVPRRNPGAYDVMINSVGYMLQAGAAQKGGRGYPKIQYEHLDPLQGAAPTDMSYSSQNPSVEVITPYDNLVAGFGQKYQHHRQDDRRYFFTSHMDLSIDGQMQLGPYIQVVTPNGNLDTTNGIVKFFEIGSSLYALNGRYVLKRTADTAAGWGTTSKDFGAAKAGLDVILHKQNATSTTQLAYVAMGDSELFYKFDGTTWTQHATLYARAFCIAGKEFWRANGTNQLAKLAANADPWVAANWTSDNSYYIGENSQAINRLLVDSSGTMIVFKSDGPYVLDSSGHDIPLIQDLKLQPDSSNGFWSWNYENFIHVTLTGRHWRLLPGPFYQMEEIGPEKFAENDSPVHGYITAGVGTPYASYAGLYNPDTGHSYLMKFGAWAKNDDGSPHRLDAWHGALSGVAVGSFDSETFGSRKITAMYMSSIGAPSGHYRVYIGCSDGTIGWFTLPCTPNPTGCTSYNYHAASTAQAGYLYLPYWNGGFLKDEKVIRAVTVVGSSLGSTAGATRFMYRRAGLTTAYTTVGTQALDTTSIGASSPGTRYPIDITATLEDLAIEFYVAASASQNLSPIASGIALHYRVNPPIQEVCDLAIKAVDACLKRDGSMMRISADQIETNIRTAIATTAGVTVIFPDEKTLTMQLSHLRRSQRWPQGTKKPVEVIVVRATQSDAGATDQSAVVHQLS